MTTEELQVKIKDQMIEISAYENKVKELNQKILRLEKIIEDLRDYIRDNFATDTTKGLISQLNKH